MKAKEVPGTLDCFKELNSQSISKEYSKNKNRKELKQYLLKERTKEIPAE